jgi:hypothetical protein
MVIETKKKQRTEDQKSVRMISIKREKKRERNERTNIF